MNDRINLIRKNFCNSSNAEFAKKLGVSTTYASNICNPGKNVGEKQLNKILEIFPTVNPIWLKLGIGLMLNENSETEIAAPIINETELIKELQLKIISQQKTIDRLEESNYILTKLLAEQNKKVDASMGAEVADAV